MGGAQSGTGSTPGNDLGRIVLADWFRRVRQNQHIHYGCANHFSRLNTFLGVPSFLLSFLVASYVFVSLHVEASGIVKIAIGLLATLVGALALLHTYLGLAQRAESHRRVSARYGALRRKIEFLAAFVPDSPRAFADAMANITREADEISEASPEVPGRIQQRVLRGLDKRDLFNGPA
jgi:hypothetical protein